MVTATRTKLRNHSVVAQQLIGGTNFPGHFPLSFDVVTCFEVLEHTKNVKDAVKWISGKIKDGGWFIGSVPFTGKDMHIAGSLRDELPLTDEDLVYVNNHKSVFSCDGVLDLLTGQGYTNVAVGRTVLGTKQRILFRGQK